MRGPLFLTHCPLPVGQRRFRTSALKLRGRVRFAIGYWAMFHGCRLLPKESQMRRIVLALILLPTALPAAAQTVGVRAGSEVRGRSWRTVSSLNHVCRTGIAPACQPARRVA